MYKEQFIKNLAINLGVSQPKAEKILRAVIKTFCHGLKYYDSICIRDVVRIETVKRNSKTCTHPVTGKVYKSRPHLALKIKAGKKLNEYLNGELSSDKTLW